MKEGFGPWMKSLSPLNQYGQCTGGGGVHSGGNVMFALSVNWVIEYLWPHLAPCTVTYFGILNSFGLDFKDWEVNLRIFRHSFFLF